MTNKERLISFLGFQPDTNASEAALLDINLDGTDYYEAVNYKMVRLAAIQLMEILLTTPNTTNQITGYSITYDRDAVERRLYRLKLEAGLELGPYIRAINKW